MGGQMNPQVLMWAVTAASIAGAWLNVRRRRSGFAVWICTNTANAARCVWVGEYAMAFGFAVFLGLAIWGWIAWKQNGKRETEKMEGGAAL